MLTALDLPPLLAATARKPSERGVPITIEGRIDDDRAERGGDRRTPTRQLFPVALSQRAKVETDQLRDRLLQLNVRTQHENGRAIGIGRHMIRPRRFFRTMSTASGLEWSW